MKNKKMKNKKLVLVLVGIVILAGAGGAFAASRHHSAAQTAETNGPTAKIDYSPATASDNAANEDRKNDASTTSGSSGAIKETLNSPTTPPSFSVTISRANASSSQAITAAANVNGTTTGTCVFNFSKTDGGTPEVSSPPEAVQASNQSAMCPPATVQMPATGNWYVSVVVTDGGSSVSAKWAANPVKL